RGVDIVLGGNPEAMARRDVAAEGLDPASPEGQTRAADLLEKHEAECGAEGEKVRELGGLYVLGTERHDSRRIDNQLRGRSGRQGDPGESRFYLSLEDELMRIFATGAMNWVMDKALPEDVPIEAKMVTKAIERAQGTVEQKNAEARKNVLKYDEVLNEQRKVIYKRRAQILSGSDLRAEALEHLGEAVDAVITGHCTSEDPEDWDLEQLETEVRVLWPTQMGPDQMGEAASTDELYDLLVEEAVTHYEQREELVGAEAMREVERQIMLRIIDQRWREHLYEMDYLKEGINLRALGQKNPLTEWQREGFEMFGQMMAGVARDFVTYIMHVEINVDAPAQADDAGTSNITESGPADPSTQPSLARAGAQAALASTAAGPEVVQESAPRSKQPVVKSDLEKTPRNAPCPCGSGRKFKQCCGR
ncbi:MAG: SEC-C metal-binding domain-containing protein, partial [bacterium]|nr:SEC-C metal-binding domain-containing protein [bacterium]